MKWLIPILLALLAAPAISGTVYRTVDAPGTAVIPPEVATDFHDFNVLSYSLDGSLLVCPNSKWNDASNVCRDGNGANRWVRPKNAVPPGKVYAGFSVTFYGIVRIYWRDK